MVTFLGEKYRKLLQSFFAMNIGACVSVVLSGTIIGYVLGVKALSAFAVCTVPIYIIAVFRNTVDIGTMNCYARNTANGEKTLANKFFTMGIELSLLYGIVNTLLVFLVMPFYLDSLSITPETRIYAMMFLYGMLPAFILKALTSTGNRCLLCDGGERVALIAFIVSSICLPTFSFLLCRRYGIIGVGLGETCAHVLTLLIQSTHFFSKRCTLKFILNWNWKDFFKIHHLGTSYSISYLCTAITSEVLNRTVLYFSNERYLPVVSIIAAIIRLCVLAESMGFALVPLVSSYLGERNPRGMRRALKRGIICTLAFALALTAALLFFPQLGILLVGLTKNPALAAELKPAVQVFSLFVLPYCFYCFFSVYFMAIQKPKYATMLNTLSRCIVLCMLTPLGFYFFGFPGFYWSTVIAMWIVAPIILLFMVYGDHYTWKEVPFLMPRNISEKDILIFNFHLVEDQINQVAKNIVAAMKRRDITQFVQFRSKLIFTEAMKLIQERNSQKNILAECTLNMNGENISLTIKDCGIIFDITSEERSTKSFRTYITSCLMNQPRLEKRNQLIGGYNCNTFVWKKDDDGKDRDTQEMEIEQQPSVDD